MSVSVFELFKPGIGPSSSHTVGPMLAAHRFVERLGTLDRVARVTIELYGSLALTGLGHGTDRAVLVGLSGAMPDTVDPDSIGPTVEAIRTNRRLKLGGAHEIEFDPVRDLDFRGSQQLPAHPNGMGFAAYDADGNLLDQRLYYSIGGGFVLDEDEARRNAPPTPRTVPYPFTSGAELLAAATENGLSIAAVQFQNERAERDADAIRAGLDSIWNAMQATIARGLRAEGELPGGLGVRRRAARLVASIEKRVVADPLAALDWVNVWALAVNEENAAGGRVVTAPTMGAAGIVPAVLTYYVKLAGGTAQGVHEFLLTAAAIGGLYKRNASISGAEVGCQGEVGVACSMAAAGLTAALGGSPRQVENAAEIGMEHSLGLTCDPVKGLVQIPCIERNAIGAVKAIEATRLALAGDGTHRVTLDEVIETMRRTGADMKDAYKETSLGGLAANVTAC